MKRNKWTLLLYFILLQWSCYEDKGNYDYSEVADITFENVPATIERVSRIDNIEISPIIMSSTEGEIKEGNPNFQISYKLELKNGGNIVTNSKWVVLNPNGEWNLCVPAEYAANAYICWIAVKDIRTGRETSMYTDVKITSNTYEGWMVLCNEGTNNRARMDMISVLTKERIETSHDLLSVLGMPESTHGLMMAWYPNTSSNVNDLIYCVTGNGTYKLNRETLKTDASWEISNTDFIIPLANNEHVAYWTTLNDGNSARSCANFCVTNKGNVYYQDMTVSGGAFEQPINTSVQGGEVEFKVAPFVGISEERPGNGKSALFYDIDNKRFVSWASGTAAGKRTLKALPNPANGMFSFQTGKEIVYMESTRFSGGVVYTILQDANGRRSIYGVNMAGSSFTQTYYKENLDAADFDKAECFAFHSQFPIMFYSVGNKVYMYNLGTHVTTPVIQGNESITMLKFNLYRQPNLTKLSDQSEEFMARQFELMVGSYNTDEPLNGGKLTFYTVDGINNTVSKKIHYSGFAKINDVVYRERR